MAEHKRVSLFFRPYEWSYNYPYTCIQRFFVPTLYLYTYMYIYIYLYHIHLLYPTYIPPMQHVIYLLCRNQDTKTRISKCGPWIVTWTAAETRGLCPSFLMRDKLRQTQFRRGLYSTGM